MAKGTSNLKTSIYADWKKIFAKKHPALPPHPPANIFSASVFSATVPYYAINNRWIAFTVR